MIGVAKGPKVVGDYGTVEQPQSEARTRLLVLPLALACGIFLCYQAARLWLADHRIHSSKLEVIERGAALEPGNAEAWDILGRHRQLDFTNADPSQALANYQRAIQDDPLSANYWMNLAGAYEAVGDVSRAQEAFAHARSVYPLSADVAWNYGNFLLRQDQDAAGYAEIRDAVQSDPAFLTLAVSRVWRSSHDVNILLDHVLPADVDAYIHAVDFFSSIHRPDQALAVWGRLISLGRPIALPRTFPFFDELILDDRSADAKRAWIEALTAAGLPHDEPLRHSAIWDGDFAHDFENVGLGWRWNNPVGVAIDFDTAPPSHGVRSLLLQFGGGINLDIIVPMQYVPVEPGLKYHFHAYMKTQGITTESGMRFSIQDPNHNNAVSLLTENLTGSHEWTAIDADVTTSGQTHFLLVQLFRQPSRLFENKLSGTVWIADISLIPDEEQAGNSSR
jgi:tetratricopeptide (TPR) repeat protein